MTVLTWIMLGSLLTVLATAGLTLVNLRRYGWRATAGPADSPLVSVCIPARNEESNLQACVASILAQDYQNIEVHVYDDQSTDQTPTILARLIATDPRVKRATTFPLESGWNGKQHACWRMGQQAAGRWMLFTDADVRFEPDCVRRAVEQAETRGLGLLSTFPRQIVGSAAEALLVPMIFFLLFSYLPMGRMRRTTNPAASAGCGQFLLVRRDAYAASGGHAAFKDSMHDGIKMPRAVRAAGFRTDLFDGTNLCSVRMYRGWGQTWRGFAKNAFEGLGSVGLLAFITALHLVGHVLPWLVALASGVALLLGGTGPWTLGLADRRTVLFALMAIAVTIAQRGVLAARFAHPWWIAPCHPIGIVLMTAVQWHSFALHVTGRRAWRGRVQGSAGVTAAG